MGEAQKYVVVTGASSGIGLGTVRVLIQVSFTSRSLQDSSWRYRPAGPAESERSSQYSESLCHMGLLLR